MDTNKTSLSLEQVLVSYNILILFLIIFIILMILLIVFNQKGFNKLFGYQIFITGPFLLVLAFLIKEIFAFKNNPQSSWLSTFSFSSNQSFIPIVSIFVLLIGLLGLFMMLYVGGIFSGSPPENNTATIINFIIVIAFIFIASIIYSKTKNKDDATLHNLPKPIQDAFHLRTKYTFMFVLFALIITMLYFFNPYGLMTEYGGPVVFFTLFVGMVLVIMITIYQYFLSNPTKAQGIGDSPSPFTFLTKGVYILFSLAISVGLIYGALNLMGIFEQNASKTDNWGHIIFNFILFCSMLGVIYKLANAGGFLDKNPYYRLFLNTLFYIPCLLVVLVNYISQLFGFSKSGTGSETFAPPKPYETKILILSLVLFAGYFGWILVGKKFVQSKYLKQGGKQLINQPVSTNTLSNIASYQSLSNTDKFDYQYAISLWIYLDAFPPNTYNKAFPLLSYGENPAIKYSSDSNTLYITVKQNDATDNVIITNKNKNIDSETVDEWKSIKQTINNALVSVNKIIPFGQDVDADGHRIIYKHSDVLLQKWNHIVLNYSGGTLDVFYNGKLVKSAIEVVPYLKFDMLTVGAENGINGNIANLMYFNEPLDILTINTLYTSLKNTSPPVISESKDKIIPV